MPCINSRTLCACLFPVFFTLSSLMLAGCGTAPPANSAVNGNNDDVLPAGIDGQPADNGPVVDVDDPDGSPDDEAPAGTNMPPTADAGSDLTVNEGDAVTLDGSASFDPDGDPLTFEWTASNSGVVVSLTGADSIAPSFTAPAVDGDTVLHFTLVVSDGGSGDSDTMTVLVLADLEAAATGPTADAGDDQLVDDGSIVTLDASVSAGNGESPLEYRWLQLSGPGVTLTGADSVVATFVAPIVSADVVLAFELTVRQDNLASVDEVAVTVRAQAPPPPPPPPPSVDNCPSDPAKTEPGICGCGVPDIDTDGDRTMNCLDGCANDPMKTAAGVCGCGVADIDTDADGTMDCVDGCANDPTKIAPGACGCGIAETDRDFDGTADCIDGCPDDPTTTNPALCIDPSASRDTDWELYMLRLVNRARRDPAGEAGRIGSSVTDAHVPVAPLAFDLLVGETANNHSDWMHDNFGSIASGRVPDSFSHFETLDGLSTGTAAVGTPSYTGANVGQRLLTAGYPWSNYGENILTNYSTLTISIDRAQIDTSHRGWWNSAGHRSNMLNAGFTSFGFHIESRTFVPPRGGLNAPFDNLLYAVQCFSTPLSNPRTYVFGVIYADRDGDGAWTPCAVGDALREGLSGIVFNVLVAGTATPMTGGTTLGNGAFSVPVGNGVYDLLFSDPDLLGGQLLIEDVVVSGANVDVGDFDAAP